MALVFSQMDAQFEEMKKATVAALSAVFPIDGKLRSVKMEKAWVEDNLDPTDYGDQQKARLGENTWGVPVYAHLKLVDKDGRTVDENPKVKLFTLPKPTQRNSFIVGGNEYQVHNQLRLKPGVYTIRKQNGELKTQLNLAKGKNFDLHFDESKGVFSIQKVGGGQANIPLYPVLIHLGVGRGDIARAWGEKIAASNEAFSDPKAVERLEAALRLGKNQNLKDYLNTTAISPDTTKAALGQGFDKVDGPLLLASSKKLLNVHLGKDEPTDRDSLEYKEVHGIDDYIRERLEKNRQTLAYRIKRSVDNLKRTKISQIVNQSAFSTTVESFFLQDDKSSTPEQTNPLEMLTGTQKITFMGAGGIGSTHAITNDMRQIHPSHLGLIDPVHTPSSDRIGVNLHLPLGAVKDGKELKTKVVDKKGKEFLLSPVEMKSHKVVLPDEKGPTVRAMYQGQIVEIPRGEADYFIPSAANLFSYSTNLIPFLPSAQGNRAEMASKMLEQAISLKHREAPLVQSAHPEGGTFEGKVGEYASVKSPVDGKVARVSEDKIVINGLDGKTVEVNLYNNFALNRKSFIHNYPTVKSGDDVKKDQLIADSNYTKGGVLALGTNLKTGYLAYKGLNFDDGIVISKSASQKLTSEHIYTKELPIFPNTITGLEVFRNFYPTTISPSNLSKLDKDGVIKKGEKVAYGDVFIAALQKRNVSTEVALISKVLSERPKDISMVWTLEDTGTVIDVVKNDKKITVVIKTEEAAKIGDKLCYSDDTELLTESGWVRIQDLDPTCPVATLGKGGYLEYQTPAAIHRYPHSGEMVHFLGKQIDHLVTKDHGMWAKARYSDGYERIRAGDMVAGGRYTLQNFFEWEGDNVEDFCLPRVEYGSGKLQRVLNVKMNDFLMFLGYYLADGCATSSMGVQIRKYKSAHPEQFEEVLAVLNRMGFSPRSEDNDTRIIVSDKALWSYVKALGLCDAKYIPLQFKSLCKEQLSILFESLIKCDGNVDSGRIRYFTTSKQLADDVQEIGSKLGYACSISTRKQSAPTICGAKTISAKDLYIVSCNRRIGKAPTINSRFFGSEARISLQNYEGYVYCVTVPNGVLYTRRNGKTLFSCNSNRHGGKGVVTGIIPDHEMPRTKDGALEILLSPMGIISRINVSQTYESAAAKAAQKTGKPFVVSNFDGSNALHVVKNYLEKHGVDDKEEVFDGETGKSLGRVHVGTPHILKLFKQSQGNFSVRQGGPGSGYDANMQPLKAGGEEGAKSLDVLTMYSMLSHGARANLREMAAVKSTKNDEFWKALKAGEQLPAPQPSFAYTKFMGYLKGAGIDVKKQGSQLMLAPLTDEQVKATSSGEIQKPLFYRAKDMTPIRGGFFDPVKLGGFRGDKWGHLSLAEPVINPPFEAAVRKLTGLGKKFDDVMAGKLHLDDKGELNSKGVGVTGGAAIESLLKKIDVDTELEDTLKKAKKAKASQLDDLNKKMRYLQALKTLNLKPEEAYIRKSLPVVPPTFRPVYPLPDGNMTSSDVNILYQNTGVINTMMMLPVMDLLHENDKSAIREDLYNHVKGVSGLTDMNIKGKERSGFISEIKGGAGGQPKEGFFISKLLSKRQDYVGRGTALPDPSLGVDQVALPESMAWKLFEPFIVRELNNHGKSPTQALDEIKQKSPLAKRALEIVMEQRHVLLNRAPSLHKFSIMAFKPVIGEGKSIKVQPLVNKGFNLDHDGDTVVVHMPVSDLANKEAEKMLPSKNLFQPGSGNLMLVPSQEAQLGLYYMSQSEEGKKKLHAILGDRFPVTKSLDKKATSELLKQVAKTAPQEYGRIVQALKDAGEHELYARGSTIGIEDIVDLSAESKKIVAGAKKLMAQSKDPSATNTQVQKLTDEVLKKKLEGKGNPFYDQIVSGAKGSPSQLRSILVSPLFMADSKGRVVPLPISKSYAAGLTSADYWTAAYGVRKGLMDTAISTSLPGAFSKDIMATVTNNVISMNDCGTKEGVALPVTSNDCLERFLANDQGGYPRNTLVDRHVVDVLKDKGVSTLIVRSPLKCKAAHGVCAHCYGLDEFGHTPEIGENVGAKSGQTISEPLVQMLMSSKHTGGVAGTGTNVGGYQRITQLLSLPKILTGAAALAPADGKVTKITKGLAGGFDVFVGDKKVHVSQGNTPTVEVGQVVHRGDALSTGPIKPQDLTSLKGPEHAQEYLTNELQSTYKAQGVGINRKTFETVVRSLTNTTQVVNKPKHTDFLPGDVAPLSLVNAHNDNLVREVSIEEAEGDALAQAYGPLKVGHILTAKDVVALRSIGTTKVLVRLDPIEHKPFVKGMSSTPLLRQDWMAALGYRNLAKVLTEGSSQGWKTDVEGYHPIPALAHGTTFGTGKEGRY